MQSLLFHIRETKTWRWEVAHDQCPLTRAKGGKVLRARGQSRRDREVLRGDYQEAKRTPMNTEILR